MWKLCNVLVDLRWGVIGGRALWIEVGPPRESSAGMTGTRCYPSDRAMEQLDPHSSLVVLSIKKGPKRLKGKNWGFRVGGLKPSRTLGGRMLTLQPLIHAIISQATEFSSQIQSSILRRLLERQELARRGTCGVPRGEQDRIIGRFFHHQEFRCRPPLLPLPQNCFRLASSCMKGRGRRKFECGHVHV
mmetsp:Transcript_3686/g.7050  ORF Transcript_3686/g.7050 Transcript_3686/m.7050 type:complete len:188 (-) Transcript_3686:921-1484(-)